MRRIQLIILLLLTAFAPALAAKITVVPPVRVSAGEKFTVTIQVQDGSVNETPKQPNIPGCTFIYGPSTYTSSRTSIVNGRMTQVTLSEFAYTYRADREGQMTIPAMSLRIDGAMKVTKPVTFNVSAAGATGGGHNAPVSIDDPTTMTPDKRVSADDVFVRIILNKSTAYEQEAIECTIKLYTKYGIERFLPTKQPSFDGFLIEEIEMQPALNQREEYKGHVYATAILKQCIIFPQKSGKLTITSGDYDLSVIQYEQVNMGLMTVSSPVTRDIKFSSNSASIDIKPLPQPAPAGFNGAVGTGFSVDARLIGNSFATGEAASLVYEVKGQGNVKYIAQPAIEFPAEMELYSPKSNFDGHVSGGTVSGTNTFDFTFVPQAIGDYKITVPEFVYFNPQSAEYVTIPGKTFDMKVVKGSDDERQDVSSKITDILPIKAGIQNPSTPSLMAHELFYWLLYLALALLLTAVILIYHRNLRLNADVIGRRMSRADKVARARLKAAKQALDAGKDEDFYTEILSAMLGYISDKLVIPVSKLSRENMREELAGYGASPELIDRIIDVIDRAEMARYTPSTSEQSKEMYDETASAIKELEKIKRK